MRAPRGSGARPPAADLSAGGGLWAGLRAPQDWHLCARWGHLSRGLFPPARVPHLLFGDAVGMTPWIEDPASSLGASVRVCTASHAALPHSKTPWWSEVAAAPASPFQGSQNWPQCHPSGGGGLAPVSRFLELSELAPVLSALGPSSYSGCQPLALCQGGPMDPDHLPLVSLSPWVSEGVLFTSPGSQVVLSQ